MIPSEIMGFVEKWEKGYVNDLSDSGGETKFGISKKSYPDLNIASLSIQQARDIYYNDYYIKYSINNLPYFMRLCVFNCVVNCGGYIGVRILQKCVGAYADGIIGKKTLYRAKKYSGTPRRFCNKYLMYQMYYYVELVVKYPKNLTYIKGWLSRSIDIVWIYAKNEKYKN